MLAVDQLHEPEMPAPDAHGVGTGNNPLGPGGLERCVASAGALLELRQQGGDATSPELGGPRDRHGAVPNPVTLQPAGCGSTRAMAPKLSTWLRYIATPATSASAGIRSAPSCFDEEAEKARVRYRFVDVDAMSWSERPAPRNPYKRKR